MTYGGYNIFGGRTLIIVAYGLHTVKKSDTIFCIEDEEILEQGSNDALVSKAGKYMKMPDFQTGFYSIDSYLYF